MSEVTYRTSLIGYNHNVRYRGRVFHVQTEDSGPATPRIFTHLYYEGSILASKRTDYDRHLPEAEVKGLMQGQHKAIMKELRLAAYDDKIRDFFSTRNEPAVPGRPEESVPASGPGAALASALDLDAIAPAPPGAASVSSSTELPASPAWSSSFVKKGGPVERISVTGMPATPRPRPAAPVVVLRPGRPRDRPLLVAARKLTPLPLHWFKIFFKHKAPVPAPVPQEKTARPLAAVTDADIDNAIDAFIADVPSPRRP